MYLPVEVYELARGVTFIKLLALATNVVIVVYIGYVLLDKRRAHDAAAKQ